MKKTITFLIAFCLLSTIGMAQTVDVVTGLSFPYGLALDGNDLYVSEFNGGEISKIDISSPTPMATTTFSGLVEPAGLLIIGDELYYIGEGAVKKRNLTPPNTPTTITTLNGGLANSMVLYNGELYITDEATDKVFKVDISQSNPPHIEVVAGLAVPFGIVSLGNNLYVSEFDSGKVTKIDLSQTPATTSTVVSGLTQPGGLTVNGNFLYIAHGGVAAGKISRIDLNETNPQLEEIVAGLNNPRLCAFDGIDLYITEAGTGKISKLEIGQPVFSDLGTICESAMPTQFGGASPTGGSYSGTGVTNSGNGTMFTFDPALAGIGTHIITYSTSNGLTVTASITVLAEPNVTISTIPITCNGANNGVATASASGSTYLWNTGATSATISSLSPGTYSVTATNTNDCTASTSVTITEPDVLVLTTTGVTNVSCNGGNDGNIAVAASGGTPLYSFTWNSGAPPNTAGTYAVTVTDNNGCTNSLSETISEPTALTISTSSTPDNGTSNGTATATGNGGTPSYVYNWSNGGMTSTIENLPDGTYEVTITDANDCTITKSVEVENNMPSVGDDCAALIDINNLFGQMPNEPQTSTTYNLTTYTTNAPDVAGSCFADGGVLSNTIWFSFLANGEAYNIKTTQCIAGAPIFDAQMVIFSGDCMNLTEVACNDDEDYGQGLFNSNLDFETEDGVNYLIMIDGYQDQPLSDFCLQITANEPDAVTNISQTNIGIFPNPTTGELQLENVKADRIDIFDNTGRIVKTIIQPSNNFNIAELSTGFYFLKIQEGEKLFSAKVIKE